MIKKKILPNILFILIIFLFPSLSEGEEVLTLATFNCEFLIRPKVHIKFGLPFSLKNASATERSEWEQPGFRDQKFNEAAKAVAGVIHNINADVIALTEVGGKPDVSELVSEIRLLGLDYGYFAVGESTDPTGQHVAVLSKYELKNILYNIPGRETYLQEMDDPETEKDTGVSKGMRVTFVVNGYGISLYAVHLASERGGHEQDQQRIAQASIIRRHYLPELASGKLVVVAGDMNDHRGQPAIRRIRGLDDIGPDLIQTGLVKYFDKSQLDTRWTYEYQGVRQQIDHVLLSYSIKNICKRRNGIQAKTIVNNNSIVSDHKPLVVQLRFQ